jgi:hypothetical protein
MRLMKSRGKPSAVVYVLMGSRSQRTLVANVSVNTQTNAAQASHFFRLFKQSLAAIGIESLLQPIDYVILWS